VLFFFFFCFGHFFFFLWREEKKKKRGWREKKKKKKGPPPPPPPPPKSSIIELGWGQHLSLSPLPLPFWHPHTHQNKCRLSSDLTKTTSSQSERILPSNKVLHTNNAPFPASAAWPWRPIRSKPAIKIIPWCRHPSPHTSIQVQPKFRFDKNKLLPEVKWMYPLNQVLHTNNSPIPSSAGSPKAN